MRIRCVIFYSVVNAFNFLCCFQLVYCQDNGRAEESKQKNVRILYEQDIFTMRQLGFYRANPTESVTWHRPEQQTHLTFISILYGLYGCKLQNSQPAFSSLPH